MLIYAVNRPKYFESSYEYEGNNDTTKRNVLIECFKKERFMYLAEANQTLSRSSF